MTTTENLIERDLIAKLEDLKYTYRPDIRDRASLEKNFREKFENLNRIRLTNAEFQILLEQITTPDVFAAAKTLRQRNSFTRNDGTPLNYTLVNTATSPNIRRSIQLLLCKHFFIFKGEDAQNAIWAAHDARWLFEF